MVKNKQPVRSLTAFLVTWSFAVLTLTGLVLYVVPQGRVAYWVHWSLLGMEKEQWAWVHMMFGGIFIVAGMIHLYFNWGPFKKFLAGKVKGHLEVKREVYIATALTVGIFVLSAFNLPPASWVIELNDRIKGSWVTSPELEPPFGHAEEVSLAGIARRMGLDLAQGVQNLREAGLQFGGRKDSLEKIARANDTTPMAVYGIFRKQKAAAPKTPPRTAEGIEARYAGTGLGRATLSELFERVGIEPEIGLSRLKAVGIEAKAQENAREVSERYGVTPVDLLKAALLERDAE